MFMLDNAEFAPTLFISLTTQTSARWPAGCFMRDRFGHHPLSTSPLFHTAICTTDRYQKYYMYPLSNLAPSLLRAKLLFADVYLL